MPFCSSGISQPIPGLANDLIITSPFLVAPLTAVGLVWLLPFIDAGIALVTLNLPTFCASDPPADPVLTATDVTDMIFQSGTNAGRTAQARVVQLIEREIWTSVCQCASVTTPPAPTAPSAPSGLASINPPGVSGTGAIAPCSTVNMGSIATVGTVRRFFSNGSQPIPASSGVSLYADFVITAGAGTPLAKNLEVEWQDASLGNLSIVQLGTIGPAGSQTVNLGVPAVGAVNFALGLVEGSSGGSADSVTCTTRIYCNNQLPGAPNNPCCPPDATTVGLMQQILSLVTLIQRNAVPFAYVPGAAHSGLTGDGTLTIPSCIGVLVTITTVPGYSGAILGSPNEIFDIGWYSWGDTSGFAAREVVHKNPQQSFPMGAAKFTRLGYSLNPGVVATIQELYAES